MILVEVYLIEIYLSYLNDRNETVEIYSKLPNYINGRNGRNIFKTSKLFKLIV
ncbi:hypothetical protein PIROE2DRAFT_11675 [Piromyces sp. E2]|nr:hypothetical protein PIROE2DRAFT_11675 [Piromyces sp. E2]|eukprot:OUM62123.1 hypothetical protein PIROE2DRAFT_11675 [Piromyces sp. E2]